MPYLTRRMILFKKNLAAQQAAGGLSTSGMSTSGLSNVDRTGKNIREMPTSVISSYAESSTAPSTFSKPDGASVLSMSDSSSLSPTDKNNSRGATSSKATLGARNSSRKLKITKSKTGSGKGAKKEKNSSSGPSKGVSRGSKDNVNQLGSRGSKDNLNRAGSRPPEARNSRGALVRSSGPALPQNYTKNPDIPFDERQILYSMELIKSNLKRINENPGYLPLSDPGFESYKIEKTCSIKKFVPVSCTIGLDATHREYPGTKLVCKQYPISDWIPDRLKFFKILRHLGKKHPSIDGAWEIFASEDMIYTFTEAAGYTNLKQYILLNGAFKEGRTQEFAWQIFKAMDFLGDMGISHRRIEPCHILIYKYRSEKESRSRDKLSKEARLEEKEMNFNYKLSGFAEAIEYWNPVKEEVILQDCLPQAKENAGRFQAPEMFGDPFKEVYDPISADVWSFGATIYYSLCKNYPYNYEKPSGRMADEIQENIQKIYITKRCTDLLDKILTIDASKRISFSAITQHNWLPKI